MNAILSFIPRLFSLRAVILVLAVVFALMGDQLALVGWADRALFSILGVPEGATPATILPQEAFGPAMADRGLSEPLWSDMAVTAGLAIAALYLVLAIPAMGAAVSLPERKRQYDKAVSTYRSIQERKKGFRDTAARLSALEKLAPDNSLMQGGSFDNTRTLLMPEPAVSRPTLGRYEIEREIGRGAMGVVYLGKDPKIARTVAIKTLSYQAFDDGQLQDLKERFFREAEAAGRLSHPALVTVYDVGEEADLAYIAMDYAKGRPLSEFGRTGRLLPLPRVLDIVARVADALAYAHSQKIVHRDIKPGNIIFNPDNGDIKITDFGIAKISDDSRTRTGAVMGSPLYMSPEQLKGQKVTGASDIYSLGVTLYKLVSGETPYQGDTLANLTYQILNKRPRSVREFNADLPNGVVRLINKAIQREPDKRFASAATMAEAVRRLAVREAGQEVSS